MTRPVHPIELLERVAAWLDDAGIQVVFTGGSTVPLYLSPIAAQEFRPTRDVDCIVDAPSYAAYTRLTSRLRELGFHESQEEGAPMCRFVREGLLIDVMPIDPEILGFSNPWYPGAWTNQASLRLPSGRSVAVFPVEYLLASKISAYESRGNDDPYVSHDFEDIVTLLDGVDGVLGAIESADPELRDFVSTWLAALLARRDAIDLLEAHVSRAAGGDDRARMLFDTLTRWTRFENRRG